MEITRQSVLIFTFVFGPLVLVSYVYGVSYAEKPQDIWGGIPLSWQTYIVPFMFIAAAGFLIYWWIIFYQFNQETFSSLPKVMSVKVKNSRAVAMSTFILNHEALCLDPSKLL